MRTFGYNIIATHPATASIPPNLIAKLLAPLPWVEVETEVATAPKEVEAPAELIRTLLVTPLITVTDVANPAGTPIEVMFG
jgi:hypothetical protein